MKDRSVGLGRNQDAYDRFSALVDLPLTILAGLWLVIFVVPLVVTLPAGVSDTFLAIDFTIWALFVVEYGVKLWLSPSRRAYVKHHVVDLLVVVVPIFRPLRALRLIRLLETGRAGLLLLETLRRAKSVLTHKKIHFVFLAVVVIAFAGAALELLFERHAPGSNIHDYPNALWWAVVTITTVGYGDHFPVTEAGRGVAIVLMITGIGLVGVLTATLASYFLEQGVDRAKDQQVKIQEELRLIRAERKQIIEQLNRLEAALARLFPGDEGRAKSVSGTAGSHGLTDQLLSVGVDERDDSRGDW